MLARTNIAQRASASRTVSRTTTVQVRAANLVETAKAKGAFVRTPPRCPDDPPSLRPLGHSSKIVAGDAIALTSMIYHLITSPPSPLPMPLHLSGHTSFVAAVEKAGLTATLSDPAAVYTVFVPTNAAFAAYTAVDPHTKKPIDLKDTLMVSEEVCGRGGTMPQG